jgi:hypothetical protein
MADLNINSQRKVITKIFCRLRENNLDALLGCCQWRKPLTLFSRLSEGLENKFSAA